MPTRTEAVTLFVYEATTDKAAHALTNRNYAGRRLARLRPPYLLVWKSVAGAGGLPATPSFRCNIQDSDDGTTWTAIAGWTVAAITGSVNATKQKAYSSQIRKFVRVVGKTISAGTWVTSPQDSAILTAVLYGEVSD
jgi:hypothetical protein